MLRQLTMSLACSWCLWHWNQVTLTAGPPDPHYHGHRWKPASGHSDPAPDVHIWSEQACCSHSLHYHSSGYILVSHSFSHQGQGSCFWIGVIFLCISSHKAKVTSHRAKVISAVLDLRMKEPVSTVCVNFLCVKCLWMLHLVTCLCVNCLCVCSILSTVCLHLASCQLFVCGGGWMRVRKREILYLALSLSPTLSSSPPSLLSDCMCVSHSLSLTHRHTYSLHQ